MGIKEKFMDRVDDLIVSDSLFVHVVIFIGFFFLAVILTAIFVPIALVVVWVIAKFTFWLLSFVVDLNAPMF